MSDRETELKITGRCPHCGSRHIKPYEHEGYCRECGCWWPLAEKDLPPMSDALPWLVFLACAGLLGVLCIWMLVSVIN